MSNMDREGLIVFLISIGAEALRAAFADRVAFLLSSYPLRRSPSVAPRFPSTPVHDPNRLRRAPLEGERCPRSRGAHDRAIHGPPAIRRTIFICTTSSWRDIHVPRISRLPVTFQPVHLRLHHALVTMAAGGCTYELEGNWVDARGRGRRNR